MESMEHKVWQRVLAEPEQEYAGEDLRQLALWACQTASIYRMLAREGTGRCRALAKGLWERENANLACLKGLFVMCTGHTLTLPCRETGQRDGRGLEGCYLRAHGQLQEYTARSAQPRFGVVYQEMARRQEASCAALAELIGCGGQ